ncbi:MAG TPA: hypothetical protein DEP45_05575 [Armatimonadetes bacterium]|nr:hypothetical protein [Armatimonadota bacterium]
MTADELRLEAPQSAERGWLRTVALMALPLAAVWATAFLITGLLWWGARDTTEQIPPPPAPQVIVPDANSVDLEAYTRAHPQWQP